ncbi:hypothetical protein PanWU01x14_167550 [Parasponia andersonii]|uniref:Uncharacterized protein n=1 Tax=Parasponia andersonii TaxID=3476 RepID=A0A2P5CBD1_PARAD|nr:hypothetical protein PanWU01x14_167550 [Parasponia andersonii]
MGDYHEMISESAKMGDAVGVNSAWVKELDGVGWSNKVASTFITEARQVKIAIPRTADHGGSLELKIW